MIKIEIQDPHLLDKKVLQETAKYLMGLSGGQLVIPPSSADLGRYVPAMTIKSIQDELQIDMDPPVPTSYGADLSAEAATTEPPIPTPDNFNEGEEIIEEAFIPVPPETVDITPPAHEVFKPASSIELDSKGLPWDRRIHARTKTKIADGSWKRLRGLTEARAVEIEQELRDALSAPAAPVPSVPPAPTDEAPTFMDLMTLVTTSITAGRLNRIQVVEVLGGFGLSSLSLVPTRVDLIPAIMVKIKEVADAPC